MIKAVIFDVDGVLLDSHEANNQFNRKLFQFLKLKFPERGLPKKHRHLPLKEIMRLNNKEIKSSADAENLLEKAGTFATSAKTLKRPAASSGLCW